MKNEFEITTQAALRKQFWDSYPKFESWRGHKQNDCPTDVRITWCDFVNHVRANRMISEALAFRATL